MTSRTLRNDTAKRAAGFYFVIHFLLEVVCSVGCLPFFVKSHAPIPLFLDLR